MERKRQKMDKGMSDFTRWDYKTLYKPTWLEIYHSGLDGWELVGEFEIEGSVRMVFKRPLL